MSAATAGAIAAAAIKPAAVNVRKNCNALSCLRQMFSRAPRAIKPIHCAAIDFAAAAITRASEL
jgi:hypothetical protein